jgi:hypothetical protein
MKDSRSIVATIVQSSVVELFRGFGLAVAPLPSNATPESSQGHLSASIGYSSKAMTGILSLLIPQSLLDQVKLTENMPNKSSDLTREFSNQLLGRIKNRLLTYQVDLRVGIPSSMPQGPPSVRREGKYESLEFTFQSLRGLVYVALRGTIDYSSIAYAGGREAATEGDIILF